MVRVMRPFSVVLLLALGACAPLPPAVKCEWSFDRGICMDRERRKASNEPLVVPREPATAGATAAPAASAPCASHDALIGTVVERIKAAPICAGITITWTPGSDDVTVTIEPPGPARPAGPAAHADVEGCMNEPAVHAALAELERCRAT
jgi:hypothetical protein